MVTSPECRKKKRVAVIGSGLAGLSAAHLLTKRQDVEVHIFEKASSIGMDSASIDVLGSDGKIHRVDSPMRAVQGGYYTHLLALYRSLGIQLEKSNFTYSFFELSSMKDRQRGQAGPSTINGQSRSTLNGYGNGVSCSEKKQCGNAGQQNKKTTFIYNGGNGLSLRPVGFPINEAKLGYILSLSNILNYLYYVQGCFQMAFKASYFALCYIYLALLSFYHVFSSHTSPSSTHPLSRSTLRTFLSNTFLPASFIQEILIPLFACVATCSPGEIMEYPAGEILEYIAKTFGSDHYVVKGGVKNAVQKLMKNVPEENIHLGCELVSLRRRHAEDVGIEQGRLELKEASGQRWSFDDVIFATQANQARFLLADYYKSLRDSTAPLEAAELEMEKARLDALGKFSYTTSIVVNHYDQEGTMPGSNADRRMLNIARWNASEGYTSSLGNHDEKIDSSKRLSKEYVMATHDLSILHPSCRSPSTGVPLLQTTNPTVDIDEKSIVSSQAFERARVTLQSKETLREFMKYPSPGKDMHGKKGDIEEKYYQGLGGIWFIGSWAAEGIPLLEGCVVSAERAVEALCR